MPIQTDSLNRKLYDLLNSRGYNPIPRDSDVTNAGKTVAPEEADVFKFTFKQGNEEIDDVWVTIDGSEKMTIYYDDDITSKSKPKSSGSQFDDSWYGLLNFLKKWAHSRQLSFDLEPKEKIDSDMAQRTYMKKKEQIAEGYYPMGKTASYNDNIPTVKIILQHTRQIHEGEQRYRNVAKIFLENTQGERILAPTVKPGIAQIYARHLAEGGVPNDERWNHIKSLCEEYSKMAGFVRAVRGNQFNESAQRLVEAGLNHYTSLRESLGRMRGHRGYNAYFESWTPTLMETEGDETNLNELFVQETLDPRIESVMPILNKLSKNLGEMKEVKELEEWAEGLLEAPGAETLAHNQQTELKRMKALDLDEADDAEAAHKKTQMPAFMRKQSGDPDWKTTTKDLEKAKERNISGAEGLAALKKRMGDIEESEGVEESGLQAYLGNKKYGKEGMDALRKAGRDGASKEKMASIRAKYDKLDEEDVEEGNNSSPYDQMADLKSKSNSELDKLVRFWEQALEKNPNHKVANDQLHIIKMIRAERIGKKGVAENLGPEQKAVGQLGPTEKIGPQGAVGKLVGANESRLNEMDSEGYKGHRGDEDKGKGPDKTVKPAKAKDVAKDAEKELTKSMDKAHKKDVKEGQEELESLLKLLGK